MAFSKHGEFLNPGVKFYFTSNGELRYPARDNSSLEIKLILVWII